MPGEKLEGAVERLRCHLELIDNAAMPTKSEVFVLCGGYAREFHDDLSRVLSALQQQEEGGPPLLEALALVADATETEAQHSAGKWRKKPVVIEAYQFHNRVGPDERPAWITEAADAGVVEFHQPRNAPGYLTIATLEGVMRANTDDWVIKGVQGELYPCKPDIFAATYEPALSPSAPPLSSVERETASCTDSASEGPSGPFASDGLCQSDLESQIDHWLDAAIAQEFPPEGWTGRVAKYIADGIKSEGAGS